MRFMGHMPTATQERSDVVVGHMPSGCCVASWLDGHGFGRFERVVLG